MTIEQLIEIISQDVIAVFFYFLIIPLVAFLTGQFSKGIAEEAPYSYIFSVLIYLVCIPGVFSAVLWGYSMFFEHKNLLELNFVVYYIPLVSMLVTVFTISSSARLKELPWFGELYELLIIIGAVFAALILMMHMKILNFKALWQLLLVFLLVFVLIKLAWERFQKMTG